MPTIRAALGLALALSLTPLGASAAQPVSSPLPEDPALLPGDPDILSEKAETYRRMDDNLLAVETADQAIKANPKLAFAWHVRSLAKRDLGEAAGTAADLAQAKRMDPTIK